MSRTDAYIPAMNRCDLSKHEVDKLVAEKDEKWYFVQIIISTKHILHAGFI